MIRTLIITTIAIVFFSCTDDQTFDIPTSSPNGDYTYSSVSQFYNAQNSLENTSINSGALVLSITAGTGTISSTPILGWSYDFRISNITDHTLRDGSTVQSFRISVQSATANSKEFNIQGTGNMELEDSDGTTIGTYDGIIVGDELKYEFESFDIETFEKTVSTISATQVD